MACFAQRRFASTKNKSTVFTGYRADRTPTAGFNGEGKTKISVLAGIHPDFPVVQPVSQSLYWVRYRHPHLCSPINATAHSTVNNPEYYYLSCRLIKNLGEIKLMSLSPRLLKHTGNEDGLTSAVFTLSNIMAVANLYHIKSKHSQACASLWKYTLEVKGQLHAPAALHQGKQASVPNEHCAPWHRTEPGRPSPNIGNTPS